ncbi:MAG: hypothetical protein D6682_08220 [Zetaproteobacteria bacterium]|nr:MAG: hypothetical protein D6682_08220 [Zetaproteobacteria bacterium]
MRLSIVSILTMLTVGLVSIIAISVSNQWAVKALGTGAMGLLLVYTVQTFVRDYMSRRTV